MSTLAEIEAAADALPLEQKQELLQFLALRLRAEILPAENADALDLQYERGYAQIPEDISLTNALMPHLAVDSESWE